MFYLPTFLSNVLSPFIKKQLVYLVFLTCVCLIGAVIIYEISYSIRASVKVNRRDENVQFDAKLGWAPIPNRHIVNEWGDTTSNSLGFRSEEVDENKKQIIVLGDSVTWGFGVSDKETMTYYLNQEVKSFNYQVSNLAVSGYGIDQEYLMLLRHIDKFKDLKYVVLVICPENDFQDTTSNTAHGKRKPLYIFDKQKLVLSNATIKKFDPMNIMDNSKLLNNLSKRYQKVKIYLTYLTNYLTGVKKLNQEEGEKVISLLLEGIRDVVYSHNAKLIVVISPDAPSFTDKPQSLIWFQDFFQKNNRYYCVDFYRTLKDHSKDLKRVYLDGLHFTGYGNKLLAEAIFKNIDVK